MCVARVFIHFSLRILADAVLVLAEAGLQRPVLSVSMLLRRLENYYSLGFSLSFFLSCFPCLSLSSLVQLLLPRIDISVASYRE